MTLFIAIISGIVLVNALLLIFSSSVSVRLRNRMSASGSVPATFKIYPLESADADYRKAV